MKLTHEEVFWNKMSGKGFDFNHLENSVVYSYLIARNYNLIAFSNPNLYFKAQ